MSSIFGALSSASATLKAFEGALTITQNNIGNASTPNYAAQQAQFDSLAFNLDSGLAGGLGQISAKDTRSSYADHAVRNELSNLGSAQQQSTLLTNLQGNFDVTGQTGISGALSSFFSNFSSLSVSPSNPTAQQTVLDGAQKVAQSFQQAATAISQAGADATSEISSEVGQINSLAAQIQQYNAERQQTGQADPSLDAKTETALESLSQLVNITTTKANDGTTNVLVGGQTPLVLGSQQYQISSGVAPAPTSPAPANPSGTPPIQILDSNGNDVTSQITQGSLAASLDFRNKEVPSLIGDQNQSGSLNQLAQAFADRVNNLLTSGNISSGPPATPGVALFSYDTSNPNNIAQSLSVNSAISANQIATIDPGPPSVSNGIALKIAGLSQGSAAADQVSGLSYIAYFGQIASTVGAKVSSANNNVSLYTQSVSQAQAMQTQLSGVSLDTEAVNLTEFQKSYDAAAKLVTTLDQISQATIDMLQ